MPNFFPSDAFLPDISLLHPSPVPLLPLPCPSAGLSDTLAPRFVSPFLSLFLLFLSALRISTLLSFPPVSLLFFHTWKECWLSVPRDVLLRFSHLALQRWVWGGVGLGLDLGHLCSVPWGPGSVWANLSKPATLGRATASLLPWGKKKKRDQLSAKERLRKGFALPAKDSTGSIS